MARTFLLLIAVVVAGLAFGAGSAAANGARDLAMRARSAEVRDLARLINRHRTSIGCPALVWDDRLAAVARRHCEDMAKRGYFSHVDPEGRDPFDRLEAAGVKFRSAAENIAEGQPTGRVAYEAWMRSPGHRRNIERCGYTHLGIGLYQSRWTLVLVGYGRTNETEGRR